MAVPDGRIHELLQLGEVLERALAPRPCKPGPEAAGAELCGSSALLEIVFICSTALCSQPRASLRIPPELTVSDCSHGKTSHSYQHHHNLWISLEMRHFGSLSLQQTSRFASQRRGRG
ncbi:hypothetical protein Q9966_005612 [Columba livia]|nr:hypothetical protein Q9966_005612 [Columba livia]